MKYTVIIPGDKIDQEQLLALRGEDSYFKGNIRLPQGAYILVPESERETLQKENQDIEVIGYEGSPKDYGTALISSMGYKAEQIGAEGRGWKDEQDNKKVYEVAEKKGKSTLEHCYSKEISKEDRGYAISCLSNIFKIVYSKLREDKSFVSKIPEETEMLNAIQSYFIGNVVEGKSDMLNENRCETEGIGELIDAFKKEGLPISDEWEEYMKRAFTLEEFKKFKEECKRTSNYTPGEIFTKDFVSSIVGSFEQSISKESEIKKSDNNILASAIEATGESVRTGAIDAQKVQIEKLQKDKIQDKEHIQT